MAMAILSVVLRAAVEDNKISCGIEELAQGKLKRSQSFLVAVPFAGELARKTMPSVFTGPRGRLSDWFGSKIGNNVFCHVNDS